MPFSRSWSSVAEGTRTLLVVNFRPSTTRAGCRSPTTNSCRCCRSARRRSRSFLRDLLGDGSFARRSRQSDPRAHGREPVLHRGGGAGARRDGEPRGSEGAYRLVRSAAELRLPATVQAVLAARIDRLAEREKQVLQTAAVIGREFTEPVLRRVVELSEIGPHCRAPEAHERGVHLRGGSLSAGGIHLQARPHSGSRLQLASERTAADAPRARGETIAAVFAGRLEEHYSDLARHYACSANREKAVPYLTLAGNYAASRSAHSEAIAHFTKALELVEGYADNSRGLAQQLPVLIGLGASLMTTKGYAAAEVEHVYERAHTICRQINASRADLFRVLFGLWQSTSIRPICRLRRRWHGNSCD